MAGRAAALGLAAAAVLAGRCDRDVSPASDTSSHAESTTRQRTKTPPEVEELCSGVFGAAIRKLEASCESADEKSEVYAELRRTFRLAVADCQRWFGTHKVEARPDAGKRCRAAVEASPWQEALRGDGLRQYPECRGLSEGLIDEGQKCSVEGECRRGLGCVTTGPWHKDGICRKGAAPMACRVRGDGLDRGRLAFSRMRPTPWRLWSEGDLAGGRATPGAAFIGWNRPELLQEPRVWLGKTDVNGKLAREVVSKRLRYTSLHITSCLRGKQLHKGAIEARFEVPADGGMSEVRLTGGGEANAAVSECIDKVLTKLAFPPHDAGKVEVTLRFDVVQRVVNGPAVARAPKPMTSAAPATSAESVAPDFSPLDISKVACHSRSRGETCEDSHDCAAELVCRVGRCAAAGARGDGCTGDAHCGRGLWCKPAGPGAYSQPGACSAPQASGALCTQHIQCRGACSLDGKCIPLCGGG